MHLAAYAFVATRGAAGAPGPVLELGGRNINGSIRDLFSATPYLSLDCLPGPGVDVVADGSTYQPVDAPGTVVCCEVLEHTPAAEAICRHAVAILRPGGRFVLTAAGVGRGEHSAVDGGPLRPGEYYRNVTRDDLTGWLSGFSAVDIVVNDEAHDIYAIATKDLA